MPIASPASAAASPAARSAASDASLNTAHESTQRIIGWPMRSRVVVSGGLAGQPGALLGGARHQVEPGPELLDLVAEGLGQRHGLGREARRSSTVPGTHMLA